VREGTARLKPPSHPANFFGLHDLRPTRQMPTYEYRCPDGHDFEKFVLKMSDAQAELACPTCGKPAARRMSAGGGLLFKGSGFYITDYGKDGKKDQRPAASADAKGGDAAKPSADAGGTGGASGAAAPAAAGAKAAEAKPAAAPAKPSKGEKKAGPAT
jgi:putative FmdB family regulatory protein